MTLLAYGEAWSNSPTSQLPHTATPLHQDSPSPGFPFTPHRNSPTPQLPHTATTPHRDTGKWFIYDFFPRAKAPFTGMTVETTFLVSKTDNGKGPGKVLPISYYGVPKITNISILVHIQHIPITCTLSINCCGAIKATTLLIYSDFAPFSSSWTGPQ